MAQEKSNRRIKKTVPLKNTEIQKIENTKDEQPNFYKCPSCGGKYTKLLDNFPASQSELYAGWDYHLPICKRCLNKMFEHYTKVYGGDEDAAIRRICEKYDIYFSISLLNASRKITKSRSRIHTYISKANLTQYKDKTYDTTLDEERKDGVIESKEHLEELKEKGVTSVTITATERWGVGLSEWDYSTLEDHYKMLKKNNPNCDNNQEIFIKSLCNLNWLMNKMLRNDSIDTTKYSTLVEQYAKTFKQAGLKTVVEKDSSNDEVVGVTLATISQFTPEEFYKDKKLFEDNDDIGDYYDRHIRRPMKNLMTGTDIRDKEYFVPENGEDDE